MRTLEPAEQEFRDVYRAHYGFVWHALRRFGVSSSDVDDATQDTFVVAFRRRQDFRQGSSTKAWLYGIARRVASNRRRTAQRHQRKHRAAANARRGHPPEDAREALRLVEGYLRSLEARDRELFVLSQLEGMTGHEIAEALRTRPSTAYGRIQVLRQELGALVGRETLAKARKGRPRATNRSWAMLVPALRPETVAAPWWAALFPTKKVAVAVGIAATTTTVAVGAATRDAGEEQPPEAVVVSGAAPAKASAPRDRPTPTPATANEPEIAPEIEAVVEPVAAPVAQAAKRPRARTPAPSSDLTRENELLRSAKAAVREGRFDAALDLTREHADAFPDSVLADMRAAVEVEALCSSGQRQRGMQKASAWLRRRPGSPMAERIRNACGVGNPSASGQGGD